MEWISVDERLPDKFATFIVDYGNGRSGCAWFDDNLSCFYCGNYKVNVTHWMPLPEPPEHGAIYAASGAPSLPMETSDDQDK